MIPDDSENDNSHEQILVVNEELDFSSKPYLYASHKVNFTPLQACNAGIRRLVESKIINTRTEQDVKDILEILAAFGVKVSFYEVKACEESLSGTLMTNCLCNFFITLTFKSWTLIYCLLCVDYTSCVEHT